VELWTGGYCNASTPRARESALGRLSEGLRIGREEGIIVHGGHGLTYRNVGPVASLPGFAEFNIGHSIVARAIFVGMRQAVEQMKQLLIQYAPEEASK